jgi:hypothetical protein
MNENLLKKIIKKKFQIGEKVIEGLPDEVSGKIKHLGNVILKSINECSNEMREGTSRTQSKKLEKIPIE